MRDPAGRRVLRVCSLPGVMQEDWWTSLDSGQPAERVAPEEHEAPPREPRRALRNRLTRWAAMAAAATRYREGHVTADQAGKQAGVTALEFEEFLAENSAHD
ncbi:MAG: hypothetical protein ACRDHE_16095 [Ktedonobacterales bacterium]